MNALSSTLENYKLRIENFLNEFFDRKIEHTRELGEEVCEIVRNLKEYTLRGGKRLRAIFMIKGYSLLKDECEEILSASAALELLQTYLLIHDDIIDSSEVRRGGPTYHKIYEKKYESILDARAKKFGESIGIVAGDLADAYCKEILLNTNFPENLKARAIIELTRIIEKTGYGQIIDLFSSIRKDFTVNDVLLMHKLKTAIYTIEGPIRLGAILAGASDDYLNDISRFAIPLGIAFQIKDDILGLFGDEKTIGKSVTSDLEEGKKTLHIIYSMENPSTEKIVRSLLGKKGITYEELELVRRAVIECGALSRAEELAKSLVKEAIYHLDRLNGREETKEFLKNISYYIVERRL